MKPMPSDNDGDEAPAPAAKPMIKPSHKGRLHQNLNVPPGQKIPMAKLQTAKSTGSPAVKKQATFAINFRNKGAKKPAAKPYSFA